MKDAERTLFERDDEAIRHSQELAAQLRRHHFPNQPGLAIMVLDKSNGKIHDQVVYPEDKQR